ncbi:IS3 family transposase [Salipiger aestuarii]|uniref:IS3 family transposase n=1 Tax=Salipiger aestuarii TaxID=568098 RepID=UPI000DB9AD02
MVRRTHATRPNCAVLPIAPSTGHDRLAARSGPAPLSGRVPREEPPRPEIRHVFAENWRGYGARKVWRQLRHEGFDVARRTVARLMKDRGIQGLVRGKPHRSTVPDNKAPCPQNKANHGFRVPAPDMLRGSGFTCVATWTGLADPR